jgi:hypothetical protein
MFKRVANVYSRHWLFRAVLPSSFQTMALLVDGNVENHNVYVVFDEGASAA